MENYSGIVPIVHRAITSKQHPESTYFRIEEQRSSSLTKIRRCKVASAANAAVAPKVRGRRKWRVKIKKPFARLSFLSPLRILRRLKEVYLNALKLPKSCSSRSSKSFIEVDRNDEVLDCLKYC